MFLAPAGREYNNRRHGWGKRSHYYIQPCRRSCIVVAALASAMSVVIVFPTLQQPCEPIAHM